MRLILIVTMALVLSGCGGASDFANYFAKCASQPQNCN